MRIRLFIALCACSSVSFAQQNVPVAVKQITAPPADMLNGIVHLPDPASTATRSGSALIPVELVQQGNQWVWSMPIHTQTGGTRVVFLPNKDGSWDSSLRSPSGRVIKENRPASDTPDPRINVSDERLPWSPNGRAFPTFSCEDQPGVWDLRVVANEPSGGYVLFETGSGAELDTFVVEQTTIVDRELTLRSSFSDGVELIALEAQITNPAGTRFVHIGNTQTGDVEFRPDQPGSYAVRVRADGVDKDGMPIVLTTQTLVRVDTPTHPLGVPVISQGVNDRVQFRFADEPSDRRTIIAAEVWGMNNGIMVPICWVSRICGESRELSFDPRWASLAGIEPTMLELRNVRVHDINSMVPIEIVDSLTLEGMRLRLPEAPTSISFAMLRGEPTERVDSTMHLDGSRGGMPGHRLMLSHGYCSDANPFPTSHFQGDVSIFEDFRQSRTHDEFALEMMAQSQQMKSFGVAAHSQGGMAALHLSTFYWSGLDWSQGERLIQSVGSPYQGTALAGNAAVLGDLFGFGCGVNDNMTYTGSANWLSLIPTWARAQVWYWTTSFEDRPFGFDYCNIITDLLLSDPDDGVIERSAGQLDGANNMGHTEGWCHSSGMRDPAQCTDQTRNTQIDMRARR